MHTHKTRGWFSKQTQAMLWRKRKMRRVRRARRFENETRESGLGCNELTGSVLGVRSCYTTMSNWRYNVREARRNETSWVERAKGEWKKKNANTSKLVIIKDKAFGAYIYNNITWKIISSSPINFLNKILSIKSGIKRKNPQKSFKFSTNVTTIRKKNSI